MKRARVIVLGIPDDYAFMQPELVALLEKKVGRTSGEVTLLPLREKAAGEA